jgi:ADP-ribose pyrophosphatase
MRGEAVPPIRLIGSPKPAYASRYGTLYDDNVEGPQGLAGTYLRWSWKGRGVIVVPTDGRQVYLWPMYRYPIGGCSVEFPRGAVDADESEAETAVRELREETGYIGSSARLIGQVHADTGLIANSNAIVLVRVSAERREPHRQEATESISAEPRTFTVQQMWRAVTDGEITCGLTVSAFVHAVPHLGVNRDRRSATATPSIPQFPAEP